ncbi:MAG: GNAT family N-acetyltransferase [Acidimicrobiales bacterium]
MRSCCRAWVEAPGSIAIGAVDECGDLLGALLGATDPVAHARAVVGRRRLGIGAWLVAHAVAHPRLAKDLIITRGYPYARRVTRLVVRAQRPAGLLPGEGGLSVGEVTYLFVRLDRQGSGVGRALVDAAVETARAAGVNELLLVTPPELAAWNLCQRWGWFGDVGHRQGRVLSSTPVPEAPWSGGQASWRGRG